MATESDPYELQRFLDAQAPVYERVLSELRAGLKQSHWMWFVFPQFAGLGRSPTAQRYAIRSREEAEAYLTHPVLGARLVACVRLVNAIAGKTAHEIFGQPDDAKFRSSMTLFREVAPEPGIFRAALDRYYDGRPDPLTLERL